MTLNVRSGKVQKPQKIVLYGPEGIGKTTFAAAFPKPLFIDTEGSTYHLDVTRIDKPESWELMMAAIMEIAKSKNLCKTLVIDTVDWAEQLCIQAVCLKYNKKGVEDFGYGKGYTYVAEEFQKFLALLDKVLDNGINVVLTAHAKMRKFEQPDEMGSYDRWEMKLSKQVAPLLKEWTDMLLFANYKTIVVKGENGSAKAQGGKRVMYTTHHPCWDAKNRHGLPDEADLSYDVIRAAIEASTPAAPAQQEPESEEQQTIQKPEPEPVLQTGVPGKLATMMRQADVVEDEVRAIFASKGYYPQDTPWEVLDRDGFIDGWIIPQWDNIVAAIVADPNRLPF